MRPSNFEVFEDDDENGSRMTQNRGDSENIATNWKKLGTREETIKENAGEAAAMERRIVDGIETKTRAWENHRRDN